MRQMGAQRGENGILRAAQVQTRANMRRNATHFSKRLGFTSRNEQWSLDTTVPQVSVSAIRFGSEVERLETLGEFRNGCLTGVGGRPTFPPRREVVACVTRGSAEARRALHGRRTRRT